MYPHKLAVFWKKRKAKYSTKPVAWFGGIENGDRGVHFWPEPDPVDSKLTLLKNPQDEMTEYQEKQWNILICNVSRNGRHQLLATGCIDISNYITERPGKVDVTVTLKPAIKKVLSGKIEFELSWAMHEDDLSHPTDQEIWEEIMKEAQEEQARRKAEGKMAKHKSSRKGRKSKHGGSSGTDIATEEDKRKAKNGKPGGSCGTDIVAEENKMKVKNSKHGCLSGADIAAEEDKRKAKTGKCGGLSGTDIVAEEDKEKTKNSKWCCSSGTDIAAEQDKKKAGNSKDGCLSGSDIAAEDDKKAEGQHATNPQSGGPQVDPSSSSNTKVGSGKVQREASPCHTPLTHVPPQLHPVASKGLPQKSEEKKGMQSTRRLWETVRFPEQPEVLNPFKDGEDALDSLSVLSSESVYRETVFLEEDEIETEEECTSRKEENSSSSVSHLCSELASYVDKELKLVQDELLSSEEVRSKLELEMQTAMSSDCEEELENLKQGWIILDNFHSKVMKRKEDLLALDKGENIDGCLNLLCLDLKRLSEVEGWRKTDEHKVQEKRVARLIAAIRRLNLHA